MFAEHLCAFAETVYPEILVFKLVNRACIADLGMCGFFPKSVLKEGRLLFESIFLEAVGQNYLSHRHHF